MTKNINDITLNATANITELRNANRTAIKANCKVLDENSNGFNTLAVAPWLNPGCCVSCNGAYGVWKDDLAFSGCTKTKI